MTRGAPRLAGDALRLNAAVGLGVVGTAALVAALVLLDYADVVEITPLGVSAVLGLSVLTFSFVAYLALTWRAFAALDAAALRDAVERTTPRGRQERRRHAWLSGGGARTWSAVAAAVALLSVFYLALVSDLRAEPVVLAVSLLAVLSAWAMILFTYAVAYLRDDVALGGLSFAGTGEPRWRDYVYVAAQVSTTFSTSDVTVTSTAMRGTVTAHALVAFTFNTVILALLVSALLAFG